MALRIGSVVLNARNPTRAASFWAAALDYAPNPHNPDFLVPSHGDGPELHLDADDRTHLDLLPLTTSTMDDEVERLIALGASRVEWTYPEGADFVVLSDTEGNLFCVLQT
ncbi:VOC family protein [Propionibacteriaceae bacterium G57]|uniref:VOC family protein n=1 Tax=Aestuariimicrobium sp. G57 TaxID=3418485 RepID=UPI003DA77086